jgi:hypothetical protein
MTAAASIADRHETFDNVIYRLSKALSDGHKDLFESGFAKFAQSYRDVLLDPRQKSPSDFPSLVSLQISAIWGFQEGRNEGGRRQMDTVTNRLDEMVGLTALQVVPALQPVAAAFNENSNELDSILLELVKVRNDKAADIEAQTTRKFSGIFGDFAKRRSDAFCRNYFKSLETSDIVDAMAISASKYRDTSMVVSNADEARRTAETAEKLVRVARELGGSNKPETMRLLSSVQTSLEEKTVAKLAS